MASTDKSLSAFGTADCPHLRRFGKLVELLEELHGVRLPSPSLSGAGEERLSSFKGFCSGLIERRNHLWSVPIRRLGIRQRMSIAHTLFLFRKTLPSKSPDLDAYLDLISSPVKPVDDKFLVFCENEVRKMFPVGWDRYRYPTACINATVSTSSCREKGRSFGGCRKWVLDHGMPDITDREGFVESCLVNTKYRRPGASRLCSVFTGGKWRKITVPSGEQSLLRPLHNSIYDHISRFDWLLRGKESPSRFKHFTTKVGEIFVSGDYESATDFLNTEVSKTVLSQILMRSRSVPNGIRRMAMDSLSLPVSLVRDDGTSRTVQQNSGQMMGYLLSFPLLCIINYITFKYAVPRDVPVKINGDDIVFRGTQSEFNRWSSVVGESGLILSVGKTLVDRRFFTLNSCLFYSESNAVKAVPFLRSTALFPKSNDPESVMGINGRFRSFCPNYSGSNREMLRIAFLKLNRSLIDATRRSVSRGLGLPVTFPIIVKSGLWIRESWYLSLEKERPIPAPFSCWSNKPVGFKFLRVPERTKEIRESEEGLASAFVEAAWMVPRNGINDWFDEMREGTYDYGSWFSERSRNLKKRSKLLGLSKRNAQRFLKPDRSLFKDDAHKSIRYGVWVKEDFVPGLDFVNPQDESHFTVDQSARRPRDATERQSPDCSDSFSPCFPVGKILSTSRPPLQGVGKLELPGLDLMLRDEPDVTFMVYPNGVGISPPLCLTDSVRFAPSVDLLNYKLGGYGEQRPSEE
nr:MAG: RNA-dependent RNA polymerase [Hangzhou botourmia-like virus 5]